MGGRGRSRRTQRKHFRDGRENVWKNNNKKPEKEEEKENNNKEAVHWQPFAIENAAFDEYYKVTNSSSSTRLLLIQLLSISIYYYMDWIL